VSSREGERGKEMEGEVRRERGRVRGKEKERERESEREREGAHKSTASCMKMWRELSEIGESST
jgi:hypothetical protein